MLTSAEDMKTLAQIKNIFDTNVAVFSINEKVSVFIYE